MKKIKVRSLVTRHSLFKTILLHDHSTLFVLEKSALPIIYFPCITASASSTVWTFCTESCFSKSSFGRGSACIFVSYSRRCEDILTPSFNEDETRVNCLLQHLAHLHTICFDTVAAVLGYISASSDTVESEGRRI